jgi:UDP-glucose 4-epimerase
VVRAFNVFGIGQKWGPGHPQKFLPTFATKAWRGEPIEIWGDGTQTMDVIHTSDLGRMLVEATQFGDDSVFDAGCGESISVNNFANFVLEVTKSKSPVVYLPMRKGEVATRIKATGEGWDKLGWQPKLSWHKVTRAIEWYKDK